MRRLLLLPLCALGLAACQEAPAPAPSAPTTGADSAAPGASAEATADSVATLADPARRLRVAIRYPHLAAGPDAVNAAIRDSAWALARRFAETVEAPSSELPAEAENASEGGVEAFYASPRVVSGRFEALEYHAGAAHPNTAAAAFTFDRPAGRPVALADLFADGTPYLDTLSAHARRRLRAQLPADAPLDEALFAAGTAPDAQNFAVFSVHPDGLRLYFPAYALGPYALGAHEAVLPWAGLRPLLRTGGVADGL